MGEVEIEDSEALHTEIERLYAIFSSYPLTKVPGCEHCVSPNDIQALHAAPLRALTVEHLSKYGWKAMTNWGDVADFKHFAPRLFELAVYDHGRFSELDIDVLVSKLGYGHFAEWPTNEQRAFEAFFLAWWQAFLRVFPNVKSTEDFLHLLAPYIEDATPFLTSLIETDSPAIQQHLVEFCGGLGELFGYLPPNWPDAPKVAQQVLEWFMDEPVLLRLKAALPVYSAVVPDARNDYPWLPYALDEILGTTPTM